MQIQKRDGSKERKILTGLITSNVVLGRIAARWEPRMFASSWANLVASWCLEFYNKHQKCPKAAIVSLFESWADSHQDDDDINVISRFLESLSYDFQKNGLNSGHVLDLADDYFDTVKLTRLKESIEAGIELGKLAEVREKVASFRGIQLGSEAPVMPYNQDEIIKTCFACNEEEDLLQFPGDLGKFYKRILRRGKFLAFMAPEKVGKTWTLVDICHRAVSQRCKTAYFECGDMTQDEIVARMMCRLAGHPLYSPDDRWPCSIKVPRRLSRERNDDYATITESETLVFTKALDVQEALQHCDRFRKKVLRSDESYLRLSCHPNSTLSTDKIENILESWQHDGWVVDVVVIDYADIIAPPKHFKDSRDGINSIWQALRRISQRFHCLVVTATQTNAASYEAKTLGRQHFSNDKRKYAHVSALAGINVTLDEKEKGISRYNWIVKREGRYSSKKCIHVAGSLDLGCPTMVSTF